MDNPENNPNNHYREKLIKLAFAKMPYGKYSSRYLSDLPEAYVVWLKNNALPKGELGNMILEIYEIKMNGLEGLLQKIRNNK
jgi:uncharacterized protein (DUF3820 family)